jgi:hypothetical protein
MPAALVDTIGSKGNLRQIRMAGGVGLIFGAVLTLFVCAH